MELGVGGLYLSAKLLLTIKLSMLAKLSEIRTEPRGLDCFNCGLRYNYNDKAMVVVMDGTLAWWHSKEDEGGCPRSVCYTGANDEGEKNQEENLS